MSSWPFLFAVALAMWVLLKGPAAKTPVFVQKVCRIGFRLLRAGGLESRVSPQEENRSSLSLKNIAIFHYFFYFFSRK